MLTNLLVTLVKNLSQEIQYVGKLVSQTRYLPSLGCCGHIPKIHIDQEPLSFTKYMVNCQNGEITLYY